MAYRGYQGYGTLGAIDRKREIAAALLGQAIGRTPRNIGEGLSAIGAALGYRGITGRADKAISPILEHVWRKLGEAWERAGEPSEQTHRNESAYVS